MVRKRSLVYCKKPEKGKQLTYLDLIQCHYKSEHKMIFLLLLLIGLHFEPLRTFPSESLLSDDYEQNPWAHFTARKACFRTMYIQLQKDSFLYDIKRDVSGDKESIK